MLHVTLIFLMTFQLVKSSIYLYSTEDGMSVEFFDCFIIDTLQYCRRPDEPFDLTRDNDTFSCTNNGGESHSFSMLESRKINISLILREWKSSVERVEEYSRYRKVLHKDNDGYLCQCIRSGSFGKNCEYQLPVGTTIDQTLQWQLQMRRDDRVKVQEYGDIVCYKGVECDSGQLCLDWREICDGIQHCMFGDDEYNCDILELNRCADDEYRCMNGMCIPDQYFLDGQLDCLDWSDEIQSKEDYLCYYEMANVKCDDRICPPNQWSCGDGQCIVRRLEFQDKTVVSECVSQREKYFMCETNALDLQWTMPNGRCHHGRYKESSLKNRTAYEQCVYLLKCTLSQGMEEGCPCRYNSNCAKILDENCSLDTIQYPSRAIIGPFGFFLFKRKQDWSDRLPHWILINGTINCRGRFISITETIQYHIYHHILEFIELKFCNQNTSRSLVENINSPEQCYRANDSLDVCNESKRCLSNSRLKDGFYSCINQRDETTVVDIEESCRSVKSYRFSCSVDELTCLSVMVLGSRWAKCKNSFDKFWFGTGRELLKMNCNEQRTDECSLLRRYIEQSWSTVHQNEIRSDLGTPFRWYCDSFWDADSGEDENVIQCRQWWVCIHDQQRCRTGQCIDPDWFSDAQWDCADGSDEEERFYRRIKLLEELNPTSISVDKSQSKLGICNKTHPFACLSPNTSSNQYKCLDFTQLGNGKIDCLGAIDERQTLKHCNGVSMLGHSFKCLSNNECILYRQHCEYRCSNQTDDEQWCVSRNNSFNCDGFQDFLCFDGACHRSIRCDRNWDCSFGEDEYMCDYTKLLFTVYKYRQLKQFDVKNRIHSMKLFYFPSDANITEINTNSIMTKQSLDTSLIKTSLSISAYHCNRGLGILSSNNSIICFCPPQYYGTFCQYHSDRLLVLLHLNLSQSIYSTQNHPDILLKILLLFFFENQVLMTHQFQVQPALEINKINKKAFHFLYSHSLKFRQERMKRSFDRSNILHSHPYSIRIEVFEAQRDKQASLVAVWQYPIDFDYLPVFRLAKVLRLTKSNPCLTNPCHPNEQCQLLMNNKSKYLCLCKSNFSGPRCSIEDLRCRNGFCSTNALCKPDYKSYLQGNHSPYCICPSNRYGDRCDIEMNDLCQSNPCLNGGICLPGSTIDQVICLCQDDFYGFHCQHKKAIIRLFLHNHSITYSAVVLQYFTIDYRLLSLLFAHQQVYTILPSFIKYGLEGEVIPEMVLAKIYHSYQNTRPDFYLLSLVIGAASVEGITSMTEQNRCPSISQVSPTALSPIGYHQICIKNMNLLCFHDHIYLCICETNHTRTECFLYDRALDRCSSCLAGGLCLRGDPLHSNDFICLCPSCHLGRYCQFNSKSLTVTLDQLLFVDLTSSHRQLSRALIIVGSLLIFFIGLPNNLFSFVTLHRQTCLHTGVGHYLLSISVINQINLAFVSARLIHLSVIISNPQPFFMINHVLCKLFNYFPVCLTRISYWFASFVALERVYTVIFMNRQWFKKPHVARRLMVLTSVVILITSSYELVFVKLFTSAINHDNSMMCMMDFPIAQQTMWIFIHQIISIVHFMLPLIINICSTMTIIYIVIKNKMNVHRTKKYQTSTQVQHPATLMNSAADDRNTRDRLNILRDVLNEHKEMIARPIVALVPSIFSLFSLPIVIVSLSLGCRTEETNRLRYLLFVSYIMSLMPQILTFFLYIYPSTFHSKEWQSTAIARRIGIVRQQFSAISVTIRSTKNRHKSTN